MKNLAIRILSFLFVITFVFTLVSCEDTKGSSKTGIDDEKNVKRADKYEYAKSLIPDVDYEGQSFRVLVMESSNTYDSYKSRNVIAEEVLSIPINDAVYARNKYLEDKLNIKIDGIEFAESEIEAELLASVTANDDRYDIVFAPMKSLANLSSSGALMDLKGIDSVNLDEYWWDQGAVRDLSIGDKLYFCASDGDILDKQTTWGVMFNKKLMEDFNLEYPYQLVKEDKWTADELVKYATEVNQDLNGDGNYDENDQWGIITEYNSTPGFYFGFDGYITKKNKDDIPEFAMQSASAQKAIDKAIAIVTNDDIALKVEDFDSPDSAYTNWTYASKMFANDQALFRITDINTVERLRNMEADFGIVPMPKLDVDQKSYTCGSATATGTAVAIPVTVQDPEKVGVMLEAFVSTSRYTLLKGYYEANLQGIITRDEESSDMLDIIFSTRHFDLGYCFDWGGLGYLLRDVATGGSNTFTSDYDSKKTSAEKAMEATINKFEELTY